MLTRKCKVKSYAVDKNESHIMTHYNEKIKLLIKMTGVSMCYFQVGTPKDISIKVTTENVNKQQFIVQAEHDLNSWAVTNSPLTNLQISFNCRWVLKDSTERRWHRISSNSSVFLIFFYVQNCLLILLGLIHCECLIEVYTRILKEDTLSKKVLSNVANFAFAVWIKKIKKRKKNSLRLLK